ncbi:NUDIX domain-containing protein [bacterium]|nr:NUDIX domain-containing protein [bacterium]
MKLKKRNSVKILLINDKQELLMMYVDDKKTTATNGTNYGPFWCPIGGGIEPGETVEKATLRELYEETGIQAQEVTLGPIVWFGAYNLILAGNPTRMQERFIVVTTKQNKTSLKNLTHEEQAIVQKVEWLSLETIKTSKKIIFPIVLPDYLPNILSGSYPKQPIEIDLGKQPEKRN